MATNDLTVTQIYGIVNAINKAANGADNSITAVDSASFVSTANAILKCSNDVILGAISQVLTETVFDIRPYRRKLDFLKVDAKKYGNIVRELAICDGTAIAGEFALPQDGSSVDQWEILRPNVLQLFYYGSNNFVKQHPSIFRNQLNIAFSNEGELSRFFAMITQNISDYLESTRERLARNLVCTLIASDIADGRAVYLLDEYATETGDETITTKDAAMNSEAFIKWFAARYKSDSDMLTERTLLFHKNITVDGEDKSILRHTPKDKQAFIVYAPFMNKVEAQVLSTVYNPEKIDIKYTEKLNFWQDPKDKMKISQKVTTLKEADGSLNESATVTQDDVLGILYDVDALGYCEKENYVLSTGMNAKGSYSNFYTHLTASWFVNETQNHIVYILGSAPEEETEVTG